ncbi:polysaccharide deacetylase family protein [Paenibacillus dendritiformis]|uniref:polysaccharide deacetylase family protein n=1 Tax=Paenibacillus dendritiformis TaxID=130049 RepID=UPI0020C2977B|nr:polysaccharide deacetylase family protein [Paenibacillus dendritiformis]CAH8770051.1 polysaccharide deacetylase family protein [Paenibacillus dendritiformis]
MDSMRPVTRKWIFIIVAFIGVLYIGTGTEAGSFIKERKAVLAISEAYQPKEAEALEQLPLKERIAEEAKSKYIAPIDARIDRVWKAIPGYNGLEVDLERTYEANKAKRAGTDITWVMRELPPRVKLDQLEPQPIYRGNPNKKMAGLMINVAWGNEHIEPMLATLKEEKVKATFFLDGSWLKKNPEMAKRIQEEGHELENHAYSHPNMSELSAGLQAQQIEKTKRLLETTLQVKNKWFAPPSGDFNALTVQTAHAHGLKTVLWTVDTVDWKHPNPSDVIRKIDAKVEPGSLILMHPTPSSKAALQGIIRTIRSKGILPGTVSETLSEKRLDLELVEPR